MSDLDKYFEKARNVEPIYEEEDTRKFLAGKLSDGGIATNLYNKIKVYPMLTALITSVATIATIALLSITSSDTVTEKGNMHGYTSTNTVDAIREGNANELSENSESAKSDDVIKEESNRKSTIATNDIAEKEQDEQKDKVIVGTVVNSADDNTIDVKAVNSLKLTKDELAKLGIELDQKSFKVNAFDKYTYTVFQSNEKTRDYYKKDEDKDAYPTPAMITTSNGFKTLTLFKKGNVEAIVDRVKSVDGESSELKTKSEQNIRTDDADIDISINKIENEDGEISSDSKFDYVVDGDTIKVDYKKSTDSSEKKLSIRFPGGYKNIKNLDSHKENLDLLVNSLDDKSVTTTFAKKDPNERKDTMLAKIDLGYVNSKFFDNSFSIIDELINALAGNPDSAYIVKHIDRIRSIKLKYQYNTVSRDYQQLLASESHKFNFNEYNLREKFDKELDSSKFESKMYSKTFQVSWMGYPDFFDEKEKLKTGEGTVVFINDTSELNSLFNNPQLRDNLQSNADSTIKRQLENFLNKSNKNNSQMRDLLQRESDKPEIIQITKENIIDLDTSFNDYTLSENSDDKNTVSKQESHSQMDTIGFNNYILKTDSPVKIFIHNSNPNMKVVNREKMKIVGKDTTYEKESYMVDMDNPKPLTKEELNEKRKAGMKTYYIENVEFVTINNVTMQDSNIVEIKENKQNINTELEVKDGESTQEFTLKPGQQVWGYEDSLLTNKDTKLYSNMSFDFINYNINELIPIEVSFDGVKTDFIVWYEANEDFLTKLPHSMLEKINPELAAISEQTQNCENAPIKKDDAVMDVWSGCSGAIKEMKVFPNPANSESKVEFELEDNRQVSIAVYDLSGRLIKKIKNNDSYSKGRITESLNLNGVNPGLYYVVVKSEIGEQALQRIIIE